MEGDMDKKDKAYQQHHLPSKGMHQAQKQSPDDQHRIPRSAGKLAQRRAGDQSPEARRARAGRIGKRFGGAARAAAGAPDKHAAFMKHMKHAAASRPEKPDKMSPKDRVAHDVDKHWPLRAKIAQSHKIPAPKLAEPRGDRARMRAGAAGAVVAARAGASPSQAERFSNRAASRAGRIAQGRDPAQRSVPTKVQSRTLAAMNRLKNR